MAFGYTLLRTLKGFSGSAPGYYMHISKKDVIFVVHI